MLPNVHNVLKDLNVGGMSHYEIEGSGVAATHPRQASPEYIGGTKVEVVIKNEQVEELISKPREKLRGEQGGKIFVQLNAHVMQWIFRPTREEKV